MKKQSKSLLTNKQFEKKMMDRWEVEREKTSYYDQNLGHWNTYRGEPGKLHICVIPEEVFYARHRNVLALIGKYDYREIGSLIAGTYYDNLFGSRSCSGYLSRLLGHDDYMDFYCGGSNYYFISEPRMHGDYLRKRDIIRHEKLWEEFRRENAKDGSALW